MTVDEFRKVTDEINRWYPDNRLWGPSEAGRLASEFQPYDFHAALQAVRAWVDDVDKGKRCLNAAQLKQAIASSGHGLTGVDFCRVNPHVWAIVEEKKADVESFDVHLRQSRPGTRLAMCANCHTEAIKQPGQLLTQSEWDKKRQEEGEDVVASY